MSRTTNLIYKDLLGTYDLIECPETTFLGTVTRYPVYQKVLSDGTKAFLHKNRYGNKWQVMFPLSQIDNKK